MLERIPRSTHRRLGYGRIPGPIVSCAADVSMAVDHGWSHFFSFHLSFCIVWPPLAATIDPQAELMTKMTNPWGARVREIKRKTEGKRPRLYAAFPPLWWKFLHTVERRHIYAARARHSFFVGVIQELLARPWHGARGADR